MIQDQDGMATFFTNRVKLETYFLSEQSLKDTSEKAGKIIPNKYTFLGLSLFSTILIQQKKKEDYVFFKPRSNLENF